MHVIRGKKIEQLFTAEMIARRMDELAGEIATGPTKDLLVIAVLKGSFIFAADLIRSLHHVGLAPEVEFITLSSYGTGTTSKGVRIVKDIDSDVKDRDVLLIDDILESGRTLTFARDLLMERGAPPCLDRRAARQARQAPDRDGSGPCRLPLPRPFRRRLWHGCGLCLPRIALRRRGHRRRVSRPSLRPRKDLGKHKAN